MADFTAAAAASASEVEINIDTDALPIPYQPTPAELRSADVSNMDSLALRWQEATEYFSRSCTLLRSRRTEGKCVINAVLDISGSMVSINSSLGTHFTHFNYISYCFVILFCYIHCILPLNFSIILLFIYSIAREAQSSLQSS